MTNLPIPAPIECPPNPDYVELLKKARAHLCDGGSWTPPGFTTFVCWAVEFAAHRGPTWGLPEEIERRLYPEGEYRTWLRKQHGIKIDGSRSVQAARLRWINQMIVEYGGTA